jgi:hypothetical protein
VQCYTVTWPLSHDILPGEAVTFFTEEDSGQLRSIANLVREAGGEVPEWMVQMKRDKDKKRRRLPPQVWVRTHDLFLFILINL